MTGLTAAEVRERVAAGRTNTVRTRTSRPVAEILRTNLLTWFNLVLGTLLVLILLYGSWRDGLFGLVLVANSAIGIAQELRAKRTLDRLALITAPRATVIRDGTPTEVAVADRLHHAATSCPSCRQKDLSNSCLRGRAKTLQRPSSNSTTPRSHALHRQ